MRDKRSRPSASVPNGYAREGASLRRAKLVLVNGNGMSTSAKIATRHRRTITIPPATANRFRRSRRQASVHRLDDRTATPVPRATGPGARTPSGSARARGPATASVPDSGVEKAIREVDDQVHERQEYAIGQHDGHDHRVVTAGHGEYEEAAHARDSKDRLHEEGAGSHRCEKRPQQGDDRDESILERVLEDDRTFAQPFGARGQRVVRPDDLQ